MNDPICQSCAMPMTEDSMFGTETDGSRSEDYCCYCYKDGAFSRDETMEEMIDCCVPFVLQSHVFPDEQTARAEMAKTLPMLKRWK